MLELDIQQLEELTCVLLKAKTKEQAATSERIATEEQIAALVPTKDAGQKTITLSDGIKVTVRRGLNYKADCLAILKYFDIQDEDFNIYAPIKIETTRKLDEKGYEWYRNNNPEVFNKISEYVEVTPKKVAVTVKVK